MVSEGDLLFDHVEILSRSVRVSWLGERLEEVSQVAEAMMEEAESDKLYE
jgi:hypothetical protein